MPSEAAYAAFLQKPEVWRIFFPPDFVSPAENDPNYVAPDHGNMLIILAALHSTLSSFVVFSRLASRLFVVRSFKLDDWLIIPALLAHISSCATVIWSVRNAGIGKHVYDCTPTEIANLYRVQYATTIIQPSGISIARMSIVISLISLVGHAGPKSRIALIFVLVANSLLWLASTLPFIFMCAPEFRIWRLLKLVSSGCLSEKSKVSTITTNSIVTGIFGVVLDFAILTIPIQLVWQLRLPIRQRVIVSVLFGIGILTCFAAVSKAVYTTRQLSEDSQTFDTTWTCIPIYISALFEMTLGLMAACGPGLKPLFSRLFLFLGSTLRGGLKVTGSGDASSQYLRDGKGSGGVTRATIGGSGKKSKLVGKYYMDSIASSKAASRSSIMESVEDGIRSVGRDGDVREEV